MNVIITEYIVMIVCAQTMTSCPLHSTHPMWDTPKWHSKQLCKCLGCTIREQMSYSGTLWHMGMAGNWTCNFVIASLLPYYCPTPTLWLWISFELFFCCFFSSESLLKIKLYWYVYKFKFKNTIINTFM